MYNISTMYETFYLLVVPRGFHNIWIKFHFDVQNTKEYLLFKEFHADNWNYIL